MKRIWLNGRLVAAEGACISPLDRGFTLGDGVFETIPVHRGRPFDLDAHLTRLARGLEVLGFDAPTVITTLRQDVLAYVTDEGLNAAVLRLTVTRGVGARGLAPPSDPHPTIVMTSAEPPARRDKPVTAIIATATRRNEHSPISRIKALPYLDNLLALREAHTAQADEALLLNTAGLVACASVANLFIVRGGRLLTPPVADGALAGTMRSIVLALANRAGLAAAEQHVPPADVAAADHVLLTNSVRGVIEVGRIDGRTLPCRPTGLVARLHELVAERIAAECG